MPKISQSDALSMLITATDMIARMASLVPVLTQAVQDAKNGLTETDQAALNDKIVLAHADVQSLAAKLETLRNA